MADLVFDVDYSDVSRAVDEIIRMGRASKDTGKAFEQGFRLVVQWQEKFRAQQGRINAELEKNVIKQNLANKSARESAAAFQEQERAIQANVAALNQMKMGYDRSYAVEQKTLQLKSLLRQAIANKTMTVREAGAELLKYRQSLIAHNQIQMAATKGANQLGVVTQQAGYQIGDFLVQVQSGTNPLVAFGQQATQLVGILPLLGPSIGMSTAALIGLSTALGIGIPLVTAIGAAFMRSSGTAKTFEDELSDLKNTISLYTDNVDIANTKTSVLAEKFGSQAGRIRELAQALADLKKLQAIEGVNQALESLSDTLEVGWLDTLSGFANNTKGQLRKVIHEFEITDAEAKLLIQTFKDFKAADGLDGAVLAAKDLYDNLILVFGSANNIPPELQKAFENAAKLAMEAARVANGVDSASVSARNFTSNLTDAKNQAIQLRDVMNSMARARLEDSDALKVLQAKIAAARAGTSVEGAGAAAETAITLGRSGATADQIAEQAQAAGKLAEERARLEGVLTELTSDRTGGGGGGADERESRLERLMDSLMTEQEQIEAWRTTQLELLQEYNDKELAIVGGQAGARLRIEQEYLSQMQGMRNVQLKDAAGFFGALAGVAAAGGDKMVQAVQIFSAAQGLINSYVAFTEVLKDPSFIGRPWARVGAAVGVLGAGLNMVRAIKGVSSSSASVAPAVSSVSSSSVSRPPAPSIPETGGGAGMRPQRVIIEGINRDTLITGEQLSNIFDQLYKENEDRGFVFEVAQ